MENQSTVLEDGYFIHQALKPYKNSIQKICFTYLKKQTDGFELDLSAAKDKGIIGWLQDGCFYISTQREGVNIQADANASGMFEDMDIVEEIHFDAFEANHLQKMERMFAK
jgi:hypothetical protein